MTKTTSKAGRAFAQSEGFKMKDRSKQRSWAEPFKIKMVEPIKMTSCKERRMTLEEAHYNTFLLKSTSVYIDLLTDSGTSAMSDYQWAGIMQGDEAYAGSANFFKLKDAVNQFYGYPFTVPTHQGRGAEHILSEILIKEGDIVPGNMYFTTTRLHQELAGGTFVDVIVEEAHHPHNQHPFKGNVDIAKLKDLIDTHGASRIPYVSLGACVNMAGGQPFSLANLKELRDLCDRHGILIMLDATRAMENAWFIKQREQGQISRSCRDILLEICSLTDGCTMSGKKDLLVNIGGFIALRSEELYRQACEIVVIYEGLHTYGGLAGRDMEAMARGIEEASDDNHLRARIGQVEYLGNKLKTSGIPIVEPIGGHAVYLDAKEFLPHISQDCFPAQALAAALYLDSGVRTMERGIVSAGRDPNTGDHRYPDLELVRLTIPRRVYTQAHMDVVAESVIACFANKEGVKGLRMTYEPEKLRFFQAHFKPIAPFEIDGIDGNCKETENTANHLAYTI